MLMIYFLLILIPLLKCTEPLNWDYCGESEEVMERKSIKVPGLPGETDDNILILSVDVDTTDLKRGDVFTAYIDAKLEDGHFTAVDIPTIRVTISQGNWRLPDIIYQICELTPCPISKGDERSVKIDYTIPRYILKSALKYPFTIFVEIVKRNNVIRCLKFDISIKE